ncbi:MAG: FecR domain-containing protein [Massilibacteroides sp.]|nr:FecR domain-containing protein [Massilibacteroides sp.]MDD3062159.1 FecR domain-containing protein [Massilibacteroides sp.]MDD4114856.1 FecR domain-containing protein [Massilibacteroides sp.]MDD4661440.1 FecR domain-containing protein [Massilibacteroides sp.]
MEKSINQLIARILNGEASSDEVLQFSNWLNADKKNQEEFCRIKSYWQAEVTSEQTVTPFMSVDKFSLRLKKEQRRKQNRRFLLFVPVAAVVLILLGITTWYFMPDQQEKTVHYYTYMTENNRSELVLSDGTKIMLNKNSQLTYTSSYGEKIRDVQLKGEAYFEVAHDSLVPFLLTMGESSICVLGTKFNAKSFDEGSVITATLVEGSIQFQSAGQQVVLLPNQQVNYNKETKSIEIKEIDSYELTLWTKSVIKYKMIPFAELISRLKETYDTEIIIKNAVLRDPKMTVSASFDENQSLDEILKVISRSVPIKWTKKDNVYYIQ